MSRGPLGDLPALSPTTRRALVVCGLLSVLNAVAVVAQAWALSSVLASVVTGHGDRPFALLAGAVIARSVLVWALDTMSARAAAGAKEELRARALDRAMAHGPEWIAARGPAELTVVATKGLDALDAYFTRYLPALVTATVVPLLVGVAILVTDVQSAVLIAITVPLIPLFAILIGRYTEQRTAKSADATARLSGHLLELVRALPVLTAFGRAEAQTEAVRRVGEQHRKATGATLRVAFLSAFALETIATLSVALVAVDIGLRLVGGTLGLATGLLVLVLTPECYLPLRAAGAAFHASEDGLEAVRRVAAIESVEHGGEALAEGEIKVDRLSVERRGALAPDGASFTVRPGHITRLDSPSGAGKSTTLAVLLGFVRPTRGRVTVGGVDLSTVDLSTWRRQVGLGAATTGVQRRDRRRRAGAGRRRPGRRGRTGRCGAPAGAADRGAVHGRAAAGGYRPSPAAGGTGRPLAAAGRADRAPGRGDRRPGHGGRRRGRHSGTGCLLATHRIAAPEDAAVVVGTVFGRGQGRAGVLAGPVSPSC
ncbi:ABC transporter [Kutzneria sp. 744]|nr:ABC transporter [Kutzneria sp. 744]